MNQIWSAQFTLPYDDPKNQYCQPFNWVEVFDDEEYIGLFRIVPSRISKNSSTREITYECEHVIATLIDDVLVGWHEIGNRGTYTNQVVSYLLGKQTVGNWVLGDCEFRHQYLYGWENENLLTALYSIPRIFTESYRWEFETQSYPWTLHLRANPIEQTVQRQVYNPATGQTETFNVLTHNAVAEIRYRKNMIGIEKTVDASSIVTRLYAFGYGEGENQLNICKANPTGKNYIDADTQSQYGIISQIWVDRRYQYSDTLYQAAKERLESFKSPKVSYNIQTAYIDYLKKCKVGDVIRILDDEDGTDLYLPLQTIEKTDMTGAPNDATLTFGEQGANASDAVADLYDRMKIEETYSQGAVTLYSQTFADNAASGAPAEMRFYIPANVVHINQIILQGRFSAFRGYTKATKGGGQTSSTTANGGSSTPTTAAGGATTLTSESGGSSTVTSASGGSSTVTSASGGSSTVTSASGGGGSGTSANGGGAAVTSAAGGAHYENTAEAGASDYQKDNTTSTAAGANVSHYHQFSWRHSHLMNLASHTHSVSVPAHSHSVTFPSHSHSVSVPSHSHSVSIPSHSHSVSIPSHTHSVKIPTHTHQVSIPAHSHNFSIPNHTHDIEYGIYKGTTASNGKLVVDGTTVGTYSSFNDLNLIPYLTKNSDGVVVRGWHTLQVTPNTLSRVELDLVIQLFANSRGGGQY